MHPILAYPRRLTVYLGGWLALGALISLLLRAPGGAAGPNGWQAVALGLPLSLAYAFLCLAAWYPCRAMPLSGDWRRVAAAHLLTALLAAAAWVGVAQWLGRLLGIPAPLPPLWVAGVLLYVLSVGGFYLWIATAASRAAEQRVLQAGLLARDAELRALKAQLNPHFLFNSLNSIAALTLADPAEAREMCALLGDFLRRTLRLGELASVPLGEELDLVRAFLAVEQVRFGERLRLEEGIAPGTERLAVPPLLLQPLVENAIKHGVAQLVEGGWIRLEAERHDGRLRLRVSNRFDPQAAAARRGGVGMSNVRARLQSAYGAAATCEVTRTADEFQVTLNLPADAAAAIGAMGEGAA